MVLTADAPGTLGGRAAAAAVRCYRQLGTVVIEKPFAEVTGIDGAAGDAIVAVDVGRIECVVDQPFDGAPLVAGAYKLAADGWTVTETRPVPCSPGVAAVVSVEAVPVSCDATALGRSHSIEGRKPFGWRSADGTGAVLDDLMRSPSNGKLKVVTIDTLREGWFGKNNAMREGVDVADGEWYCFADADCRQTSRRT